MNFPPDRHGDNRWNQALDALIAAWSRVGPDVTLGALRDLELTAGCRTPCDPDCEAGRAHCWNWHRPASGVEWLRAAKAEDAYATIRWQQAHIEQLCVAGSHVQDAATREAGPG